MFSNRIFQIAFLISLVSHSLVLFQNTNLNLLSINKKEQNLEVSYIKESQKARGYSKVVPFKQEPFLKLPQKISVKKIVPPPFIDTENMFNKNNGKIPSESTFIKPALIKPDIIAIRKKITLPLVNIEKIDNPSYISYYQIIREKIKRAAYQNYTRTERGEVYLSFIVSSNGYLKEVRLMEKKSSTISYLREIALRSLKDASPFPNFPKELDYSQLSFNIVISFEIE